MQNFNHDQFIRDNVPHGVRNQAGADGAIRALAQAYADREQGIVRTLRDEARRAGLHDQ
ncbi:MAG: hypothetical protein GWO24_13280, partial [Akkermansiaceae bacterium]|nr:hypothetical protein [Akkermansiaceae bacterium]